MRKKTKLVFGVGVNDADYSISGCLFYKRWAGMLKRCYSSDQNKYYSTYIDCFVCDEWLVFSNFKSWMENQDWKGKELDKDLLHIGNKVYSPDKCVFIPHSINTLFNHKRKKKSDLPIGAVLIRSNGKYAATLFIDGKPKYLGCFEDPELASEAYKKEKIKRALELAESESEFIRNIIHKACLAPNLFN